MVGILLITHGRIGDALLDTAKSILGKMTTPVATLSTNRAQSTEQLIAKAQGLVNDLDQGEGVLVLTDLYGSTPHNITKHLENQTSTVSGLNISMLLRALNYANYPLQDLAEKAQQGGLKGICCQSQDN